METSPQFDNSYTHLSQVFYSKERPQLFSNPQMIRFNESLATDLNLFKSLPSQVELAGYFSGQKIFKNSAMIAKCYGGHQFGHWAGRLGDGRAILIVEVLAKNNKRYDIQLKGAGRTLYSRGGDGLSPIGPVIREYLLSEAMHALSIPTTRALAAVTTGEEVYRDEVHPGAVLTRVMRSDIRIGTFEYFSYHEGPKYLQELLSYTSKRLFNHSHTDPLKFYKEVSSHLIQLVSSWMSIGFIHGVMNTDNMSLCGETIDYGPCAFMDIFRSNQVYSFIDRNGRYAYNQQPNILLWNLQALGLALAPLLSNNQEEQKEIITASLEDFKKDLETKLQKSFGQKLGLKKIDSESSALVQRWFSLMETKKLDFTNSFQDLAEALTDDAHHFYQDQEISHFLSQLKSILAQLYPTLNEATLYLQNVNPFVIARNHLVEKAIHQAEKGDYQFFHDFNEALSDPYTTCPTRRKKLEKWTTPPTTGEAIKNTFCGT